MPPIRRYLRITKYSVLELRIYLDNPAIADSWLLRRDDPALPRIIQAVRPLVLPKLREENERSRSKGKGKKGVKDVVVQDDFEVSIFLTELSSRHSLLTKHKSFRDKPRIQSNSGRLTGWLDDAGTAEKPITELDKDEDGILNREEMQEVRLTDIPDVTAAAGPDERTTEISEDGSETNHPRGARQPTGDMDVDDKKMALNTTYDGFSIYGRILCLVVKRRGTANKATTPQSNASGQQMLENWVSTQAVQDDMGDDDQEDDG